MARHLRDALWAAVLAPLAYTGYLYALGFRQAFTMVQREVGVTAGQWALFGLLYLAPVAAAGALATVGWRRGLRSPAVVVVAGLLASPALVRSSPGFGALMDFAQPAVLVLVATALVAGLEHLVRSQGGGSPTPE